MVYQKTEYYLMYILTAEIDLQCATYFANKLPVLKLKTRHKEYLKLWKT